MAESIFRPCVHPEFETRARIVRLTDTEGGPVTGYKADIQICCAKCQLPFRFIGLSAGSSPSYPTISLLGDELRAPIEPAADAPTWDEPTARMEADNG